MDTRRYYQPPLHQQKVNSHLKAQYTGRLPHTERIAATSLTLPMFSHLTEDQVNRICDAIERLHQYADEVNRRWEELAPEKIG